jgi:hydroxypyruvate isomerase
MPERATSLNRRRLLLAAAAATPYLFASGACAEETKRKGRVKQSVVFWCFNIAGEKWDVDKTCQVAKELGCTSVEIVPPEDWPTLKKHGLTCAIAPNGMPGAPFMKGLNNPRYQEEVVTRTKKTIDACAEASVPSVIAFSGYKWKDAEDPKSGEIGRDEGADNCVKALKELAAYAEKKKVTVCIEHLNTRDDTHPMKGHPGYQGDDLDWMAQIVRRVGSERVKLLFDIYHVQIMHGDVIRRIEQNKDLIGHIHTAGNPGRGELDDTQEINYPAIMRKLVDVKYAGYVGQEFIPTRNPLEGLRQAVQLCDV